MAKKMAIQPGVSAWLRRRFGVEQSPSQQAECSTVGMAPVSHEVARNMVGSSPRDPQSQTSAIHTRMSAMMGRLHPQRLLDDLDALLGQVVGALQEALAPRPELALVGVDGRIYRPSEVEQPKGPTIMMMGRLGDLVSGKLKRKLPGQWANADVKDVEKAAKQGDASAKTALKLAKQGKRLRDKVRGK